VVTSGVEEKASDADPTAPGHLNASAPGELGDAAAEGNPAEQRRAKLTLRQEAVLREILAQKEVKEIADTLGVCQQTVWFHRARLLEKSGAVNDIGIVLWALGNGYASRDRV
jgi:DNA-binding NarL/FixJ family response regulator